MSAPRFGTAEPSPSVAVGPDVRTGAGSPVVAHLTVTNRAPEPRIMAVTALGLDASWLPHPSRSRPVLPGQSISADLTLVPATGTVPARYPFAIAVQALDPVSGQATSATAIAEAVLVVDAPGQIAVELEPAESTAVFGRRLTVLLHNTGSAPAAVRLEVRAPQSTHVGLSDQDVTVPAGHTVPVRGRLRVVRPHLFGHRSRHTFTVTARSSGAPRHAEGSLTARAMFGPVGTKFGVLVTVVALWAALAIIFIPKLANSIRTGQDKTASKTTQNAAPAPGGSGGAGGSGGTAGGGGGAGGSGGTAGGGGGAGGGAASGTSSVQLNGTVAGSSPGGVHVAIAPTSLVDEAAQGATPLGFTAEPIGEVGKVPQEALGIVAPSTVSPARGTSTNTDGSWSLAGVKAPGYYLLTFSKPGYQTQRFVVDSSAAVATQPLKIALIAGQGRLTGTVAGPSGPVGAAQLTITDGTNTITTSSNSQGNLGSWSVDGLSTPSTYLVSASKDGLSTESQLVTLGAGGTASVSLALKVGVASLQGLVTGVNAKGLGGATITATDGTTTRTATTVTAGPIGRYTLPDLAVPGRYTVTFAAPGYLTQTARVVLAAGQGRASVGAALKLASAVVTGRVVGPALHQDGSAGTIGALVDAGMTLSSPADKYKITTDSFGRFQFTGVAPGTYVLSAEYANLTTGFQTVKVGPGDAVTVGTFRLAPLPQAFANTSITGFVGSATVPNGTLCPAAKPAQCVVQFDLTDSNNKPVDISQPKQPIAEPAAGATSFTEAASASGATSFRLKAAHPADLPPGVYHLTVSVKAPPDTSPPSEAGVQRYLTATVAIQVPLDGVATVPQLNLFPTNTIAGTVSALGDLSADGPAPPYTNCVVAVPAGDTFTPADPANPCASLPASATDPCAQRGLPAPGLDTIVGATGLYSIDGLCDDTYTVLLIITNPDYVSPAPIATETVQHGQTVNYSPHVFRKGRVQLSLFKDANGTLVRDLDSPTAGAQSVQCTTSGTTPSDKIDLATAINGQVTITGVTAGTASCSATGTGNVRIGITSSISISNDLDTVANMVLAPSVNPIVGQVVSNYGSASGTLVRGAQVTISGITGYDGATPTSATSAPMTTGANGCVATTDDGSTPTLPVGSCAAPFDAGSVQAFKLVSNAVTFSVVALPPQGGYLQPTGNITANTAANSVQKITLQPVPSAVTGTLTTTDGSIPTGAAITVTKTSAPGSGTPSVKVAPGGTLSWTDSNYDAGHPGAWPGTYTLTAKLAGYEDATAGVFCDFNKSCVLTPTSPSTGFQLVQLGALSGSVAGILNTTPQPTPGLSDPPTTGPAQALIGATVTAVRCDNQATAGATSCTTSAGSTKASTKTAVDGSYSITGAASQLGLARGWWQVTISASGYASGTENITIASGPNTENGFLYINLATIKIGVVITSPVPKTPQPSDLSTTAIVTLTRLDNLAQTTVTTADTGTNLYTFTNVVPTTYQVSISGPGVVTTTDFISIPNVVDPASPTTTIYLAAGVVQNTVSGSVAGEGPTGVASGLNGVTVDLGFFDTTKSPAQFVVATDGAGNPLSTKTVSSGGVDGTFSFSAVPNGNYVPRYTYLLNGVAYGYVPVTGSSFSVFGGQLQQLQPPTLTRIKHNVSVKVTSTSAKDTLAGSTVSLTASPTDSNPAFGSFTAPAGTGATFTASFNTVPSGCWTLDLTLPDGHFATPVLTAPATAAPLNCTSNLTVPGAPADTTSTVSPSFSVDETGLALTVTATSLDPNTDTPPTLADATFKDTGTNAVYTATKLAVGSATTVWLPTLKTSATYTVTALPNDTAAFPATAWPAATKTGVKPTTSAITALTLDIHEATASLAVKVTGATTSTPATVTMTCTDGQSTPANCGATTPPAALTQTDKGTGVTFSGLAPGTWSVTATIGSGPTAPIDTALVTLVAGKSGHTGDGTAITLTPH